MAKEVQSAEDFSVDRIYITSERIKQFIDIKNVAVELNIFENINMPFLTGSVLILDDNNIFNAIDFQGTERLNVELSMPVDGAPTISKTFIMNRIEKVHKSNDKTSMLLFNLIEDIGFYNSVQNFSKSYDGRGEEIIAKILNDKFGRSLYKRLNTYKTSYQSKFRLIVPYLNPFQATKMALDKMTTENGSPYFLYSSLYTDDLVLADLDTIIGRQSFNYNEPFQYDQSVANDKANSVLLQARSIYKLEAPNQEDTLLLSELGALGSDFTTTNMTDGKDIKYEHDVNKVYKQLLNSGVLPADQDNILLDNLFVADPSGTDTRKLSQFNSRKFSQIGGGKTFPYQQDISNWTYETDPTAYKLKMFKYAIEQLLNKNNLSIIVPGLKFMTKDITTSVGNQVAIAIYKNEIVDETTNPIDTKRSGNYIMLSKRHVFNIVDVSHTVQISCARIANRRIT